MARTEHRNYTGSQPWTLTALDLGPYLGQEVRIYFSLYSDTVGSTHGFYVDDLRVDLRYATTSEEFAYYVYRTIPAGMNGEEDRTEFALLNLRWLDHPEPRAEFRTTLQDLDQMLILRFLLFLGF